jgi:6,7-dimethyl-8-ribityllumazine synthase
MPNLHEGALSARGMKIAIIASRFNDYIVDSLLAGAIDAIKRSGGKDEDITVYRAPGAFEIPQVLKWVVGRGGVDGVICLGAVIRGATPHFDYVAGAVARGVSHIAADSSIPISFGVLTTDTIEQAIERAGTKAGNKGFEAAMSAIEMVNLHRSIAG